MTDWADEEADRLRKEIEGLHNCGYLVRTPGLANALRAAELRGRASGMREAAEMFRNDWLNDTDRFYDAAEAFEKIKAAASKLSPT